MSAVWWLDRSRWLPSSMVLLGVVVLGPAIAEPVTISWNSDCKYTIQFDTKKYDERRVRNTIDLLANDGVQWWLPPGAAAGFALSPVTCSDPAPCAMPIRVRGAEPCSCGHILA